MRHGLSNRAANVTALQPSLILPCCVICSISVIGRSADSGQPLSSHRNGSPFNQIPNTGGSLMS